MGGLNGFVGVGGLGLGQKRSLCFCEGYVGFCWILKILVFFGEGNEVCYRSSIPMFSYPARLPTNILGSPHYP